MEELEKLLAAGFIQEVYYPKCLANVVMVKTSNGKWWMYIDFTGLNNAYPKDSFPLPRIDQLVDSTAGYELLTFMDVFSSYNQIRMPFGLKNARANYQRLVNQMFSRQIGRNMEVYVDDMLVKRKKGKFTSGRS